MVSNDLFPKDVFDANISFGFEYFNNLEIGFRRRKKNRTNLYLRRCQRVLGLALITGIRHYICVTWLTPLPSISGTQTRVGAFDLSNHSPLLNQQALYEPTSRKHAPVHTVISLQ